MPCLMKRHQLWLYGAGIVAAMRTPAGVGCGAAASGHYQWNNPTDIGQLLTCMIMAGPFLTGYTQTINDWYDREIDAINEPYRPIPSGKISGGEVIAQIWVLLIGGVMLSAALDSCELPFCSLIRTWLAQALFHKSTLDAGHILERLVNSGADGEAMTFPSWCA